MVVPLPDPKCGRMIPIAVVPLIIRFGAAYPPDELRRCSRCDDCGHRGMTLSMRSSADALTGFAPLPKRFITDARGIAFEPNRSTHYHGDRPMEWWLWKQEGRVYFRDVPLELSLTGTVAPAEARSEFKGMPC
jgi:hypothetical protein